MHDKGILISSPDGRKHETPGLNTRDVSSSTIYQNDTALFAEYKQVRSQCWHAPHRRKPVATSMSSDPAYLLSILNASRERRFTGEIHENILIYPTKEEIHSSSVFKNWFVQFSCRIRYITDILTR